MKVKCTDNSIWHYKSRKVIFFTHRCKIQLFGTFVTDTNEVDNITIKESGRILRDKWYINYTFIRFVCSLNGKNDEYEINVAVRDE